MLAAGALRHVVDIQKEVEGTDSMGVPTRSLQTVATVRAAVWPIRANEAMQNLREGVTVSHRVRMRYRDDVDESCTLIFRGYTLDIKSVINVNAADEMLDILCEVRK